MKHLLLKAILKFCTNKKLFKKVKVKKQTNNNPANAGCRNGPLGGKKIIGYIK